MQGIASCDIFQSFYCADCSKYGHAFMNHPVQYILCTESIAYLLVVAEDLKVFVAVDKWVNNAIICVTS